MIHPPTTPYAHINECMMHEQKPLHSHMHMQAHTYHLAPLHTDKIMHAQ